MAQLLKDRGRRPVVESAAAIGSMTWKDNAPHYRIDLFGSEHTNHSVILTRAEMLGIVSEWLKIEARAAADETKKRLMANG